MSGVSNYYSPKHVRVSILTTSMDNRNGQLAYICLFPRLLSPSPSSLFPCGLRDCKQFDRRKNATVVDQGQIRALFADSANKIDEFADVLALKRRRQGCEDDRLREHDRGRSDFRYPRKRRY